MRFGRWNESIVRYRFDINFCKDILYNFREDRTLFITLSCDDVFNAVKRGISLWENNLETVRFVENSALPGSHRCCVCSVEECRRGGEWLTSLSTLQSRQYCIFFRSLLVHRQYVLLHSQFVDFRDRRMVRTILYVSFASLWLIIVALMCWNSTAKRQTRKGINWMCSCFICMFWSQGFRFCFGRLPSVY